MNITVRLRNVYGEEKAYPVCDTAAKFAALIGTKTLTKSALKQIKALGFTINFDQSNAWEL